MLLNTIPLLHGGRETISKRLSTQVTHISQLEKENTEETRTYQIIGEVLYSIQKTRNNNSQIMQ